MARMVRAATVCEGSTGILMAFFTLARARATSLACWLRATLLRTLLPRHTACTGHSTQEVSHGIHSEQTRASSRESTERRDQHQPSSISQGRGEP